MSEGFGLKAINISKLPLRGHSGQGTVEYILMLFVALMTFFIVIRSGLGPLLTQFQEGLSERVLNSFFGGGSAGEALHQLRIGK